MKIVFSITQETDGAFVAECLSRDIFTEGNTWEELRSAWLLCDRKVEWRPATAIDTQFPLGGAFPKPHFSPVAKVSKALSARSRFTRRQPNSPTR